MNQGLAFELSTRLLAPARGVVTDSVADFVRRLEPRERAQLRDHLRGKTIKIELTPILLQELNKTGGQ